MIGQLRVLADLSPAHTGKETWLSKRRKSNPVFYPTASLFIGWATFYITTATTTLLSDIAVCNDVQTLSRDIFN